MLTCFGIPLGMMALSSLHSDEAGWTLANYGRIIGSAYFWGVLISTLRLAAIVTASTLILGYTLAYYIVFHLHNGIARRVVYAILITPLFTSAIVLSFGWILMLGPAGAINHWLRALGIIDRPLDLLYSWTGIAIALTYTMLPLMVLTISSVLQNIDRVLLAASADLGGGPFATFVAVTFPLSLPGVATGSLIVFALSVSAYVVPSIMSGGRHLVISMLIYQQYMVVFDFGFGAALSIVLLIVTFIIIGIYSVVLERSSSTAWEPT
ncbi:MAG TPA: ABC transporter permease [Acetobacteraceae bacterium]|jgi:putative spermidine/putrescine transport system permease protein|nr:ABC transporter permease [Acetobacteraceae bacterium]